jgi:ABC-type uncharacterized transport system substrate-binding protein
MKKHITGVALSAMLFALCLPADAQPPGKVPRIGFLSPFSPSAYPVWHQAFRQGLRDLGWVERKNISIEYRYAEGQNDRLPDLAAELVRRKVDIIVASVTTDGLAAKNATGATLSLWPLRVTLLAVGLLRAWRGLAAMLRGCPKYPQSWLENGWSCSGKSFPSSPAWLCSGIHRANLLTQLEGSPIPRTGAGNPASFAGGPERPNDFDKAFEEAARTRAGALTIMPDVVFLRSLKRIADLAAKSRLPSIFHITEFVDSGGLMAYGPDRSDLFRRAAMYVDKILKGAKPADLPVEQPTKFEFAINLKTAKQLGLTIPQSVLYRADKVIK